MIDLWDEIEQEHEARVAELVGDIETRVRARVMLVIAEQLQAAQWAELTRQEKQLRLSVLRLQRAKRRWERATRYMRILQRSHARANMRPLRRAERHPGLEEIAVQEASRRVEAARGPR